MSDARERVRAHLLEHSVRRGQFTLKSGRPTDWFLDSKRTICAGEVMADVGELILAQVPAEATAIGGLTMGADPVAYVAAAVAATRGRPLNAFAVRKEAKGYGQGGRIGGALGPSDRVVITEDTTTRGTSMFEAVTVVRELGATVLGLLAFVDRGGTCGAMAAAADLPFWAVFTAPDLGFSFEGP